MDLHCSHIYLFSYAEKKVETGLSSINKIVDCVYVWCVCVCVGGGGGGGGGGWCHEYFSFTPPHI